MSRGTPDPLDMLDELTTIVDLVECARLACHGAPLGDAVATTLAVAGDRLVDLKAAIQSLQTQEVRHAGA